MWTTRLGASALALLSFAAPSSALAASAQADATGDALVDALATQHGVSEDVAERIGALMTAAAADRSTHFRKCFDREGILDRAEALNGSDLNAIERMALRRTTLTPLLDDLEEALRVSLSYGPEQARMQRELPNGLRSVVLRLQTNWDPSDYYLFLLVSSEDDDTLIVDFEFEDAGSWASEQVALVGWATEASEAELREFNAYSERLPAAMEAYDAGEQEDGFRKLLELQPLVAGLPLQVPAVYERLLMEYAFAATDYVTARAAAERLQALRPDYALAYFFLGRMALDEARYGDARRLFGLYQAQVGLDASSLAYAGDSYLGEGHREEALSRWSAALDQNAGHNGALVSLGMHLPVDRLGELVARLHAVPSLEAVIENLLDNWWTEGSCEAVEAASEALRGARPEDANAYYYVAQCALDAQDAETAIPLARKGRELAPNEELEAYDILVVRGVALRDGTLEGYGAAQLKAAAFDYLAYGLSHEVADAEALLALVAAREKDDPDELWLHYYRGKAFGLRGEAEAAREQYTLGEAFARELRDEDGIESYRYASVRAAYEAGEAAQCYAQRTAEDVYDWLIGWSLDDRDGLALEALMEVRQKLAPEDPEVPFWKAHALILSKRAERGIDLLLADRERWESDDNLRGWFELDVVTGSIELGRFEQALEFARQSTERDGDPLYELYVYVAQGDVVLAQETFERLMDIGYDPYDVYVDRILGDALRESEAMKPFRLRWPEPTADESE